MTLRELIKEVAEQQSAKDPHDLAKRVAKAVPMRLLREFLAVAIVGHCRHHFSSKRNNEIDGVLDGIDEIDDVDEVDDVQPSTRASRCAAWWADLMDAQESFNDGGWKRLGDCTVDDLRLSIKQKEANMAYIQVRVDFRKNLVSLMLEHDAAQVDDLPPHLIKKLKRP